MTTKRASKKLASLGIKTTADLDRYIELNPQIDRTRGTKYLESRYGMLKRLVGEDAADSILHDLSIICCCKVL